MGTPSFRRRLGRLALGGGALLFAAAFSAPDATAQVRLNGQNGAYQVSVMSWRDIPFRTVVRQQYDYSCGSAALATLLAHHYAMHVGEAEIFQNMYEVGDQARIREVGFSMLDMKRYLESRGFRADGLRLSLDRLAAIGQPVIALIQHDGYRHFVVIKGIDAQGRVLVGDPTFGLQIYDRADFEAVWNGIVLAVRGAPEGVSAPVFNLASDWRSWSSTPFAMARGAPSPSDLLRELPSIYQVSEDALR